MCVCVCVAEFNCSVCKEGYNIVFQLSVDSDVTVNAEHERQEANKDLSSMTGYNLRFKTTCETSLGSSKDQTSLIHSYRHTVNTHILATSIIYS